MKFILSFFFLIFLLNCAEKSEADWTVLVYMASDNYLNNAAIDDINEMIDADFSDKINIIVQIDYAANSDYSAHRYEITPQNQTFISSIGEIDSGDYTQLASFVNWGFSEYPATKKALFIWGHGNGWYSDENASLCTDDESGNFINVTESELKNALKHEKLDILVFDACNMQTLEIIAEIYEYTDYVIAAEDGMNGAGFPYNTIFSDWEDFANTENLAKQIGFNFHYSYWFEDIFPISCSVAKTSEFPQLFTKLAEFTANWNEIATIEAFRLVRAECWEFNEAFSVNLAMDIDVKEFFTTMGEVTENDTLISEICDAIDNCFIFQKTEKYDVGYPYHEVSTSLIWFPDFEANGFFENRKTEYEKLEFAETGWISFLEDTLDE